MPNDFLNIDHARTDEQKTLMEKIQKDGVCPFCWEHFEKYHPKPILKKTPWWIMTENISPYGGASTHYLFVYKDHVTSPTELKSSALEDLFSLIGSVEKEKGLLGGTIMMRFGDGQYTGASVTHLHAHLVSSGKKDDGGEPIYTKIAYSN